MVQLIIEARGGYGCDPVYDTIELSIIPHPLVFAGVDANVCESEHMSLQVLLYKNFLIFTGLFMEMERLMTTPCYILSILREHQILQMAWLH